MSGKEPSQTLIPEKKPGDLLAGRYRIEHELGRGGMGIVYLAKDEPLGLNVAVKTLPGVLSRDERAVRQLKREARNANVLPPPNICRLDNIEEHEPDQFLVMEYIAGASLDSVLVERRRYSVQRRLAFRKRRYLRSRWECTGSVALPNLSRRRR